MPKPTSQRMFRFLQAIAHGKAKKKTSLSPKQAKAGLSEAGSFRKLPKKAKHK